MSVARPGRTLPPGKDPALIVQEAGCAPGSAWTGAENLAPTGIGSPDHPARSQSLHRLSNPAQVLLNKPTQTSVTKAGYMQFAKSVSILHNIILDMFSINESP
jgi:hypothetical protein